jgi:hypothetical protein
MFKKHHGLTLVELLGSIVILGLVSSLLVLVSTTFIRVLNQIYDENSLNAKGLVISSTIFGELTTLNPDEALLVCDENTCMLTFSTDDQSIAIGYELSGEAYLFWIEKESQKIEFNDENLRFSSIVFHPIEETGNIQSIHIRITIIKDQNEYEFSINYIIYRY